LLSAVLFTGDEPTISSSAFNFHSVTVYYLPGTTGWGKPSPVRQDIAWAPAISAAVPPSFTSSQFRFTVTGNANIPVRIEACDSLTSPFWFPVTDANLDDSGTLDFSDYDSAYLPARFYRLTFPH